MKNTPKDNSFDAKALGKNSLRAEYGLTPRPDFVIPQGEVPVAPGARDPYRGGKFIGQQVKGLMDTGIPQKVGKFASTAMAIPQGISAVDDAQSGNYAGALEHGIRAGVAALPMTPVTLGAMGAIQAGDQIYKRMDDSTKDTIGRTINAGVRHVGNALGQDWGVDDTALRQASGVPLSPGVNAGAVAPKPQLREPSLEAKNAAMLAKFAAENAQGPAKLNDIRNVDNEAGTMEVFTKGNGDKAGWTVVSTPEAKAKRAADALKWNDEREAAAEKLNAQTAATLARFAKQDEMNAMMAAMDRPMGKHKRAALSQIMNTKAQTEAARENALLNADTNLRTTSMNNETQLMGNKMTNAFNARKFGIEQGWKEREFEATRGDKVQENRRAEAKAWDDHAATLFQTVDPESKKSVPDAKRIADFTAATDATVASLAQQLAKSGDPKKRAYGEKLALHGRAALDEADRAEMVKRFKLMELHRDSYGISPLASGGNATNDLSKYASMRPQAGNIIQQRVEVLDAEGNPTGATIPNVNLEYGAKANHLWPNFGQGSNSLR